LHRHDDCGVEEQRAAEEQHDCASQKSGRSRLALERFGFNALNAMTA
jgi:hypothetical protein